MKILIGTTNPAKLNYYSNILKEYDVECISLHDIGVTDEPEESGHNPTENSEIKVRFYSKYYDMVICNDAGLYIEDLPFDDKRQPGLKIRSPQGKRLDDEQMIEYYTNLAHSLGGKIFCYYLDGISIYNHGEIFNFTAQDARSRGFYMIDKPSRERRPGWPLDSISLNKDTLTYFIDQKNPIKTSRKKFDSDVRQFIVNSLNLKKKEE